MARTLASIQKIISIEPIEGADKIEKLTVQGWHIVASKSENHKVGDLVVYIEIDSQCPNIPMFEFLKDRKYRVRTIKLRGQVSQGLVIPLRVIEENFKVNINKFKEGQDVTELLGITKYDPEAEKERKLAEQEMSKNKNPIHKFLMKYKWYREIYKKLNPNIKGGFPGWIKKTDETRVQSIPDIFYDIVSKNGKKDQVSFDITEKIDGQSATYFIKKTKKYGFINNYEFGVCSRNLRLKTPTNSSYWTIAKECNIETILKNLLKKENANSIVLQGEIAGTGIQKNKYNIDGYKFFAFNLIIDGKKHRTCEIAEKLKSYNIDTVPILETEILLKDTIDDMVEYSIDKSKLYNTQREGIVCRDLNNNISFKVINPKFLLKNDE